jgi:NAD(P)H-dependent FMN reductase
MTTTQIKKIGVIVATTRPQRIGPEVVKFIVSILSPHLGPCDASQEIKFSLSTIAIADFNLPIYDEILVPQMITDPKNYTHAHTRAWSAAISPCDAYIVVTPSYNGGPPAALKNAFDFLYNEWTAKPIYFIGYGIDGGKRAIASLSVTCNDALKMKVVDIKPELVFPGVVGPALYAAISGTLTDGCVEEWKQQSSEIAKGFESLKSFLIASGI